MRKALFLSVCMLFLVAGWAQADTLTVGGTYSYPIYLLQSGAPITEGGGSIFPSSMNGTTLPYLYCVDLLHTVSPDVYNNTAVNDQGFIHGSLLTNAAQVAWLLAHYGTNTNGAEAQALQAAIWHTIYANVALDYSQYGGSTVDDLYDSYLFALGNNQGNIGDFLWITPGKDANTTIYQGLVTAKVPVPAAVWLLGTGLIGLVGIRRKFKK